jgi:hypothetical protein
MSFLFLAFFSSALAPLGLGLGLEGHCSASKFNTQHSDLDLNRDAFLGLEKEAARQGRHWALI